MTSTLAVLLGACATTGAVDSQAAVAHYDLGVSELRQGQPRDALRSLTKAVEADPEMARAHNALGLVYHALGRDEEGLVHYEEAVDLDPEFSEAFNNMGILLADLGRYDEAIEAFETALNDVLYRYPTHAEANMGWAYYKRGDVESAVRHLRNAVATNPKFCRGYEWLAVIGIEQHRPDQAVANVHRFEKHCVADETLASQIPATYRQEMSFYLARGYHELGDTTAAKKSYADCALAGETSVGIKCAQSLRSLR